MKNQGPDMGDKFETVANAMNEAGIGAGALPALDYWQILPINDTWVDEDQMIIIAQKVLK